MNERNRDRFLSFARLVFNGSTLIDAAKAVGAPDKWAGRYGIAWMKRPEVKAILADLRKKADSETINIKKRIVEELSRIAFGDIRKIITWDGETATLKPSSELSDAEASMIDEVQRDADTKLGFGKMKLKKADKLKALELLGKHLGMFETNAVGSKENPICINNLSTKSDDELLAVVNGIGKDESGTH